MTGDRAARLEALRRTYLADVVRLAREIQRLEVLGGGERIRAFAHQLKGSGRSYGFGAITDLAEQIERRLRGEALPGTLGEDVRTLERVADEALRKLGPDP